VKDKPLLSLHLDQTFSQSSIMKTNRIFFFFAVSTLAVTAGCQTIKPKVDNAQYWQRSKTSETVYINGPKAQQLLNRDIARCVTELRELERLGQIKDAIPTDIHGKVVRPDEEQLKKIDSPERDGYLFAEHKNYQTFEGCMEYSGWERTQTVSYEVAKRAEKNFFANHINFDEDGMSSNAKRGEETTLKDANYND